MLNTVVVDWAICTAVCVQLSVALERGGGGDGVLFMVCTVMFDLSLQLKTTSMHLHNIFNVPQVVSETYDLIKDGRLLEAHRK